MVSLEPRGGRIQPHMVVRTATWTRVSREGQEGSVRGQGGLCAAA